MDVISTPLRHLLRLLRLSLSEQSPATPAIDKLRRGILVAIIESRNASRRRQCGVDSAAADFATLLGRTHGNFSRN